VEGDPIVRGLWMTIKVRAAQGVPLTKIAADLGIDPKTARKLRDADAEPTVALRRRSSKLDDHATWIRDRLGAGVPAAQLQRDLKRREVDVPYPTLRDFARKLRPPKTSPIEEVRFETPPAKQAQCDWSELGTIIDDGVELPLHVFVMILGYSRKKFGAFATCMDELMLQRLHVAAFRFFNGIPYQVLYDNLRTVTIGRDQHFKPILQEEFADFSALYGFEVKCARPYRAKTKGKVERAIGFIQTSFVPGRTFTSISDAQYQLDDWLAEANGRVHRTHGEVIEERFAREAPLLTPLRSDLHIVAKRELRRVNAEGFVEYRSSRYQLPADTAGRVRLCATTVNAFVSTAARNCFASTPRR
ncbi:MAG: IS21 family transposase, partial [Candidatus Cybelea sp.]